MRDASTVRTKPLHRCWYAVDDDAVSDDYKETMA
jgi:hypothetical protein